MIRTTSRPARPARRVRRLALPVLLAATLALGACGSETDTEDTKSETASETTAASSLAVQDPWVRATTGAEDTSMTAAFMAIDNEGEEAVTIVSASSPTTKMVELHEMAMVDGKSVMQEIEGGIVLEPGRGQLLQPGGMHVMLMGLTQELAPGDEVELTLELSDGSTLEVTAPVKEFTEETEHYHAPGTDEDHEH